MVRLLAGRIAPAYRFRTSAPIVTQEGVGQLRRDDLVAPSDLRVYRNGQLVTSHIGFVLTSMYQMVGVEEEVDKWFEEAPALTWDESTAKVGLTLTPKPTVHGNLYLGFTLVDLTLPQDQASALYQGPNTTQFLFLRIVQVNTRPSFTAPSIVNVRSIVAHDGGQSEPETLDGIIQNITAGALDEDVLQTLALELTGLTGADGAGHACEHLLHATPAVSYAGFPSRSASISLHLQPFRSGRCTLELTLRETAGVPEAEALAFSASLAVVVSAVNQAPSFTVLKPELLIVESSGSHAIHAVVGNVSDGEPALADAPSQSVSMLISTVAATPPSLFAVAPSISASAAHLTFTVSEGESGLAMIRLRAKDDGGTLFGGQDSSEEASVRVQVLARPRLSAVHPTWWMASEVDASNLRLTITGEFFGAARAASQLPPFVTNDQMSGTHPAPGAYAIVGGHPCLRTELISDSEVLCIGIRPFAHTASVNVRVIEPVPHGVGPVIREGTLGVHKQLQRVELLVGGATDDGRGFVAAAANSSLLTVGLWNVVPDRPVRALGALASAGSVIAAGTFQSTSFAPAAGEKRTIRTTYILSGAGLDTAMSWPTPSSLGHGLDGAVTSMTKIKHGGRVWVMLAGSFTRAFLKSSAPSVLSSRARQTVVKGGGLLIWGPAVEWSAPDGASPVHGDDDESQWREVSGKGCPQGAMTATASFLETIPGDSVAQRTLVFVGGRFHSVASSPSRLAPSDAGGLMMLDWASKEWSPLCGTLKARPEPDLASPAASSTCAGSADESQGCGVRGGDILAISVSQDSCLDCGFQLVVGGTFSHAAAPR